jgi:hypothetical protein
VVTDLTRLVGPATAAIADQLVAVYRAATGAPPFFETEVEAGWFAEELAGEVTEPGFRCWFARDGDRLVGFAYGFPPPRSRPTAGTAWCGRPSGMAPPSGWRASSPSSGSPSTPSGGAGVLAAGSWNVSWPGRARSGAWLITHDLDTPARALYRSLGFRELGHGPLGWHDADRLVLGAALPPSSR